ncbi:MULTISPECIES: gamma-glutamyltransferase [unclassified Roseitalea]|uniref:gamma-glutamyltransferase family protein n=1 Tax=unclassified Roseitalea TaxID=2639107 RepID=UPI00273E8B15|nr:MULTISPECIES: gamma-glutamyltransferase [unclassified Roseitalea]
MDDQHDTGLAAPFEPDKTSAGGMRNADAPTPSVYPPPESMRPTLVGRHYMVCAGHPIVAQIMANVLEAGGTAIDAGVAGGFACTVIQPDMCNLGGIAPVVVRQAGQGALWTTAGVGVWGEQTDLDAFRARWGDDIPLGPATGIVPGAPDALLGTLARFGTWSFADIVEPLIAYARDGLVLDHRTAIALGIMGRSFAQWDSSRAVYWPKGRAPRIGEVIRQTDLAGTLEAMSAAETGSDRDTRIDNVRAAFYGGPIAEAMVAFNRAHGGTLNRADLDRFRGAFAPAPEVDFDGWRVATSDFGTQGPVMLQALGILRQFDLAAAGHGSADALHLVIEALKLGFADRELHYCDPAFARSDQAALLAAPHLAALADRIEMGSARAFDVPPPTDSRPRFDTTYACAVDAAGNAMSVMPSDTLDGSPIVPGIGAMVSCRGVQSRLDPAHVNVLAPGKRPRVTPAPAIALRPSVDGADQVLAFGCPGGDVIVQAMLQGFVNLIAHGMLPQQAVEAARVATFALPNSFFPNPAFPQRVDVENRIDREVRADLAARGHKLHEWPSWEFDAGAVMMAGRIDLGGVDGPVLSAAADPRRTAYAAGR